MHYWICTNHVNGNSMSEWLITKKNIYNNKTFDELPNEHLCYTVQKRTQTGLKTRKDPSGLCFVHGRTFYSIEKHSCIAGEFSQWVKRSTSLISMRLWHPNDNRPAVYFLQNVILVFTCSVQFHRCYKISLEALTKLLSYFYFLFQPKVLNLYRTLSN